MAVTIEKMVLNRISFLVSSDQATKDRIGEFAEEYFYEFQDLFGNKDQQAAWVEDEANYSMPQKSFISDLVSINMLSRRAIENMEGSEGSAATGNKTLKKGKAGEAEVEFQNAKESDGSKIVMACRALIGKFQKDAARKARKMGFILDFLDETQFSIEAMGSGIGPVIMQGEWEDE